MTSLAALAYLSGLGLGASLIVAIGAQNAFVLKQGLARTHVFIVALICALSDAILIWIGAFALSAATERVTGLATIARFGGAAFLLLYGLRAGWRAIAVETLQPSEGHEVGLLGTVATCLAFTWANPHVYLDTVVLVGFVASRYQPMDRTAFALGATSASVLWFFGLAYGARLLTPLFAKPLAWRLLEAAIAVVMLVLGVKIAVGA